MIKKKLDYIIFILSVHSVAFIDRIKKLFVSALFINSVQEEEILFKFHSVYKGWKYIFYFFPWCEGRR